MSLVKEAWFNAETVEGAVTEPEEVTGSTRYGLQISYTGAPSAVSVYLEGSIDGINWMTLVTADKSNRFVGFGLATTAVVVKYIRLNLDTLNDGTDPTVTTSVVAV